MPNGAVLYRRLRRQDQAALRAHLLRLDRADRHLRFGRTDMSDADIRRHCQRIDWSRAVLIGCEIDGQLRGVGELDVFDRDGQDSAEIAVTVEAAMQGQGIGSTLFRRLVIMASNRGLRRLFLICFTQNARMQRIAKRYGAELKQYQGEIEGELTPPWPTSGSLAAELLDEALATWRTLLRGLQPAR